MPEKEALTSITADIVSAHVSNNSVTVSDLPVLIKSVHDALSSLRGGAGKADKVKSPVVSVRASVKPDYLVCMECGSKKRTLKRHLQTAHGMTPEQYRKDYGLPQSYPMTAPSYSQKRREMAHKFGLGRKAGEKRSPKEAKEVKG